MAKIACLIVNWSTVVELEACLSSLRRHEGDLDTFVWQNYHPEVSHEVKWITDDHHVKTWLCDTNMGHGAGINQLNAFIGPGYDYLFILNPDCAFIEPVTERLVGFLEEDSKRCIVGPKQMDSQGRITAGGIFGTLEQPAHRYFRTMDKANTLARDTHEAIVVAGSAMMISREDFNMYGGMLPTAHYFSETFLCYHSRFHGRTNWYWGEPVMIHEWHRSTAVGSPMTDGKFKQDQDTFRTLCNAHDPPIPHD